MFDLNAVGKKVNEFMKNTSNWEDMPADLGVADLKQNKKNWDSHTSEQKKAIENFICDNVSFKYVENFKTDEMARVSF